MPATEAQIHANRQNAARSTGPKTPEGKEKSRRNALKHGLTGAGVVLPHEDAAEVERRLNAFHDELQPVGDVAEALARRAAILSVRLDRCVKYETATLAGRVRQAEADFVAPDGVDPATAEQLKAEARDRAMFDPSKEATLARKYEAATERGFYRALKELRERKKQAQATEPEAASPELEEIMASFSRFNQEAEAFEAEYFPEELRTYANPPKRFETNPVTPMGGRVDVPMTIGRSR